MTNTYTYECSHGCRVRKTVTTNADLLAPVPYGLLTHDRAHRALLDAMIRHERGHRDRTGEIVNTRITLKA